MTNISGNVYVPVEEICILGEYHSSFSKKEHCLHVTLSDRKALLPLILINHFYAIYNQPHSLKMSYLNKICHPRVVGSMFPT